MQKLIIISALLLFSLYILTQGPNDSKTLFLDWMAEHGKSYASGAEQLYRLEVFTQSLAKIREHNSLGKRYTLGLTQFADLTQEEFIQTYLSLDLPQDFELRSLDDDYEILAESDFTSHCPAIKNQGKCGSCWAFSAVGSIECNAKLEQGASLNLSEQDLVDCSGEYGNRGCGGGWMDDAMLYIQDNGIAAASDYPYTAKDGFCKQSVRRDFKLAGHHNSYGCEKLVSFIAERTVSVAVDASNWSLYKGGVFSDCQRNLNHGVVAIAYDAEGNWKIRNSWGSGWGEDGMMRLAKGDTCGVCQTLTYPLLKK